MLDGRDFVQPDDVKLLAYATLGHRVIVSPGARVRNIESAEIVDECISARAGAGRARARRRLTSMPGPVRRLIGWARRYPNVAAALVVAGVCFIGGFATGFWLLFRLAYLLLLVLPVVYIWTRSMINDLEVDVVRRTQRVSQGQSIEGRIVLRNTSRIPKVWLEIEDSASIPGHASRRVATLGAHAVQAFRYQTPALRRGLYELGPVTITATDPFGFFRLSRTFGSAVPIDARCEGDHDNCGGQSGKKPCQFRRHGGSCLR